MNVVFYILAFLCAFAAFFTNIGCFDEEKINPNNYRWYDPSLPVDKIKWDVAWSKKATAILLGLAVIFFLFGIAASH